MAVKKEEKEIQDQTFKISVKTFFAVGAGLVLLVGEYIVLQSDIEEAKRLPEILEPTVTRIELDLKNQILLEKFEEIEKDIENINQDIKEVKRKIYNL
tara:strand:+ start:7495 stop:7788 length:294 start_codon:yes stop_codon:yes gene_type:complete